MLTLKRSKITLRKTLGFLQSNFQTCVFRVLGANLIY